MKYIYICLLLVFVSSCSSINTDSREYYHGQKMRHGIIPKDTTRTSENIKRVLDANSVVRGKKIYSKNCMSCHGQDGNMIDNVDLSNLSKEVPNFNFYLLVSRSKESMPGWKSPLSKQDIKDLESYLYSL
ncbi:c-type cytochrome [Halobacteriovorax sp. YZS-1-1]|uniref:c-type cytochrome n=1 Tax=unclassified Halobacteriovorax TaxID=2639665 RepID=UPI00399BD693